MDPPSIEQVYECALKILYALFIPKETKKKNKLVCAPNLTFRCMTHVNY